MQSNAITADDKARAETIAASVDEAALARFFAGDQNALDREVDLKNITLADKQFYAGLIEKARIADQGDATTKYGIDVGAEQAEADRKTRVDILHTTIAADERARADKIAADLELTEINNLFAGDQNALARAVEDKRITLADAQFYAGLTADTEAKDADRASSDSQAAATDATNVLRIETGADTADARTARQPKPRAQQSASWPASG